MLPDLAELAERIVRDNPAVEEATDVHDGGVASTHITFYAPHGMDWTATDDFGGRRPVGVESVADDTYRVWFQQRDK